MALSLQCWWRISLPIECISCFRAVQRCWTTPWFVFSNFLTFSGRGECNPLATFCFHHKQSRIWSVATVHSAGNMCKGVRLMGKHSRLIYSHRLCSCSASATFTFVVRFEISEERMHFLWAGAMMFCSRIKRAFIVPVAKAHDTVEVCWRLRVMELLLWFERCLQTSFARDSP